MTPIVAGLVGVSGLAVLMFMGMPIGYAMLATGFAGFAYVVHLSGAFQVLFSVPYGLITSYDYAVLLSSF